LPAEPRTEPTSTEAEPLPPRNTGLGDPLTGTPVGGAPSPSTDAHETPGSGHDTLSKAFRDASTQRVRDEETE
jgi:hypothetical protein